MNRPTVALDKLGSKAKNLTAIIAAASVLFIAGVNFAGMRGLPDKVDANSRRIEAVEHAVVNIERLLNLQTCIELAADEPSRRACVTRYGLSGGDE